MAACTAPKDSDEVGIPALPSTVKVPAVLTTFPLPAAVACICILLKSIWSVLLVPVTVKVTAIDAAEMVYVSALIFFEAVNVTVPTPGLKAKPAGALIMRVVPD